MDNPQPEKLELSRTQPQDLRIYFMIARPIKLEIANEKVIAILAYDIDSAVNKAKTMAQGLEIIYYGQTLPVKELIDKIYLDSVIIPPPALEAPKTIQSEEAKPPDVKRLNREQFKWGLLLVLNEFVKVAEDKQKLKEIIEKI
jgi:hypothetical protein